MKEPIGDWRAGVGESGLYKEEPTYGEAKLSEDVGLRYYNPEPLEYDPLSEESYEVVLQSTVVGLANELFGKQWFEVDEEEASRLLEHNDGVWTYIE